MKLNKHKFNLLTDWTCILLAFLAFCAVSYFIWFASDGWFTADCADTLFWGQATLESGKLFNPSFHYQATLCFGGSWIMIPGLLLFGVGMTAQKFGMFLFLLLLTGALYLFFKALHFSNRWSFFAIFVILSTLACSVKLREIFFQHIIYYSLGNFHMLVGVSLLFLYLQNKDKKHGRWYGFGTLLWSVLCCTNGLESIVLYAVPILLSFGILVMLEPKPLQKKAFFRTNLVSFLLLAITCICGYLLGSILSAGTDAYYAEAFSGYGGNEYWATNLTNMPFQFILLFLTDINDTVAFKSIPGIIGVLQIFFAIACLVIPIIATFFFKKFKTNEERFCILLHWITTALILFAFIFGRLGNANWRLSPLILTSLIVCFIFFRYLWQERGVAKRFSLCLLICSLIVSLITVTNLFLLKPYCQKDTGLRGLTTQLEKCNVNYAYASFWNGLPITFYSQGKVFGATVDLSETGDLLPSYYGASDNWYAGHPDSEKGVLVLTTEEYNNLNENVKAVFSEEEQWNEFHICTLSHDIFPSY